MKNNLRFLKDGIDGFDSDVAKSEYFYNTPQARIQLINEVLAFSAARLDLLTEPTENKKRVDEILKWLDNNYHGHEWSAHEVHFHTNFKAFASCTFTCLAEISDVLEKLINQRFAA